VTDTPIYNQLCVELLNGDVPTSDDNAAPAPEVPAGQSVSDPGSGECTDVASESAAITADRE
jgi:hypothetical protein